MSARLADVLVRAEHRLRARGLTGAQAFDALLPALESAVGGDGPPPGDPELVALSGAMVDALGAGGGADVDLLGLAYERFFADLFKGLRGQFFTPGPIGGLLVAGLAGALGGCRGRSVLDPTCGSGGLLVHAARAGASVRGIELDPRLARLAAVNVRLAGGGRDRVATADFFAADPGEDAPFDGIVANPPFSVPIEDPAVLDRYACGRARARVVSDRLFVEAIARWVRPGGAAAIVLPFSVLANPSWADVRARIDADWARLRVCALPEGVFRPFGGAAGRAVLLWLVRRGGDLAERPTLYAALADPGYDVRSTRMRPTRPDELAALVESTGEHREHGGWTALADGAWTPDRSAGGVAVGQLARVRRERAVDPVWVADLADADRSTGEVLPVAASPGGPRYRIDPGDVLVAQLRPNLGNVALAPDVDGACGGSPEWIVLEPARVGAFLTHALRTPTWRASLPVAHGQTRPRIGPDAVLASAIRWPGDAVAERIHAVSSRVHAERRRLRAVLVDVQGAVDRFAAGEIDEAELGAEIDALESRLGPRRAG